MFWNAEAGVRYHSAKWKGGAPGGFKMHASKLILHLKKVVLKVQKHNTGSRFEMHIQVKKDADKEREDGYHFFQNNRSI